MLVKLCLTKDMHFGICQFWKSYFHDLEALKCLCSMSTHVVNMFISLFFNRCVRVILAFPMKNPSRPKTVSSQGAMLCQMTMSAKMMTTTKCWLKMMLKIPVPEKSMLFFPSFSQITKNCPTISLLQEVAKRFLKKIVTGFTDCQIK